MNPGVPWHELMTPVIYGDPFDCAVTLDEVHRFGRRRIGRSELAVRLDSLVETGTLAEREGFYCLPGREDLAARRRQRRVRAGRLAAGAARTARWLRHVPFVRGIYLTGSVAAECAEKGADVDLLIITDQGRLATVFFLLGGLSRVLSRRVLCPNYYLGEVHLAIDRRSHYVARELAQAVPLVGQGNPLMDANPWVDEQLPNLTGWWRSAPAPPGCRLQKLLEFPLRGGWGERLEQMAKRMALWRLEKHYRDRGRAVPGSVSSELESGAALRFHASERIDRIEADFEARWHPVDAAGARGARAAGGKS